MDAKAKKLIIKSRLFEKKNILFILINLFIFLAFLITISLLYFTFTYEFFSQTRNPRYTTIEALKKDEQGNYLPYDDYAFLNNLDYVVFHENSKYERIIIPLNISSKDVEIEIKPLLDIKELKLSKSLLKNEIICTNYMMNIDYDKDIVDYVIKTKKLFGNSIDINNTNLKLTGTYSPRINMSSLNTCYVSKETFEDLAQNEEPRNSEIIRIDNQKNVNKLREELRSRGLSMYVSEYRGDVKMFIIISVFIALIILVITFTILYNFIKKKTIYRLNHYGILKVSGYKDKDIINLEILESSMILLISFIIAYIIYYILYKKVTVAILYSLLFESELTVDIPIIIPILSIIVAFLLTTLTIKKLLKHYFKYDISEMLEGD